MERSDGPHFAEGKWYGSTTIYKLVKLRATLRWSEDEIERFYAGCVERATTSPLSVDQVIDTLISQIMNNQASKEEMLQVETIIVITSRTLQHIDFAMNYADNYSHGTDGHLSLLTIATLAGAMGFQRDEEGKLVIPDRVRVDDGPTTGYGKAG